MYIRTKRVKKTIGQPQVRGEKEERGTRQVVQSTKGLACSSGSWQLLFVNSCVVITETASYRRLCAQVLLMGKEACRG